VPGWYGVCSVKWLVRLELLDHQYEGYFQSEKYTILRREKETERKVRLTRMPVKSQIIRPSVGSKLRPGVNRIAGIAWAGEEAVSKVEVSTDGGFTWHRGNIVGPQAPYSWVLWEYLWHVSQPGKYELMCRATSDSGQSQPDSHDALRGGYMINFTRPHSVSIVPEGRAHDSWGDATSRLAEMTRAGEELSHKRLDVEMHYGLTDGAGI